jgi:hypothetical protein
MSARPTVELLRQVLPALRRMVRFPGKTLGTISTELNIELAILQDFIRAHGKPTQLVIEEYEDELAASRDGLYARPDISAPARQPRDSKAAIDERRAREGRNGTLCAREDLAPNNDVTEGEPWTRMVSVRRAVVAAWIPALRAMVGGMAPKEAAAVVGKTQGAFWQFRNSYFGPGKITPERLEAFLAWCRELEIEGAEASAPAEDEPIDDSAAEAEQSERADIAAILAELRKQYSLQLEYLRSITDLDRARTELASKIAAIDEGLALAKGGGA